MRLDGPVLWRLNPKDTKGQTYLSPVSKESFVHIYLKGLPFDENYAKAIEVALLQRSMYQVRTPQPFPFFQRHSANKRRMRRSF